MGITTTVSPLSLSLSPQENLGSMWNSLSWKWEKDKGISGKRKYKASFLFYFIYQKIQGKFNWQEKGEQNQRKPRFSNASLAFVGGFHTEPSYTSVKFKFKIQPKPQTFLLQLKVPIFDCGVVIFSICDIRLQHLFFLSYTTTLSI